jgi:hypothetical protein
MRRFVLAFLVLVSTAVIPPPSFSAEICTPLNTPALADDSLTVTMISMEIVEKTGSNQIKISYRQNNNTTDRKLDEGSFSLFFADGTGMPQYGGFNYFFPGDSRERSYTWEYLKSQNPLAITYNAGFFAKVPNATKLNWAIPGKACQIFVINEKAAAEKAAADNAAVSKAAAEKAAADNAAVSKAAAEKAAADNAAVSKAVAAATEAINATTKSANEAIEAAKNVPARPAQTVVTPNTKCAKVGMKQLYRGKTYTCIKSGKKLVWDKGIVVKAAPSPAPIVSQTPKPVQPSSAPSPSSTLVKVPSFTISPILTMENWSERPQNNSDGIQTMIPIDGYAEIYLPSLPIQNSTSKYFVVIDGNSIRACWSGIKESPTNIVSINFKMFPLLVSLLPKNKGIQTDGVVVKVEDGFPISFRCYYENNKEYSLYVIETINNVKTLVAKSERFNFTVSDIKRPATPKPTPTRSPIPSQATISPGAFCAPVGATGVNSSGMKYTCKTSETDTRNRWRQ